MQRSHPLFVKVNRQGRSFLEGKLDLLQVTILDILEELDAVVVLVGLGLHLPLDYLIDTRIPTTVFDQTFTSLLKLPTFVLLGIWTPCLPSHLFKDPVGHLSPFPLGDFDWLHRDNLVSVGNCLQIGWGRGRPIEMYFQISRKFLKFQPWTFECQMSLVFEEGLQLLRVPIRHLENFILGP